jgi:DNA repair exonuclease SbcCD ATPase subunit
MPVAELQATDTLFEEVEAKLESLVGAYRTAALPKASLEREALRQLNKDQSFLKKTCDTLRSQLAELDASHDHETTQLHLNFEPLLLRLSHFDEALRISGVFKELETRLQAEIAEIREASIALSKLIFPYNLPKFEAGLEMFMDRCDKVADQLDSLENQGHEIAALMPAYEQWLFLVDQFGDILDERTEILKPKETQTA